MLISYPVLPARQAAEDEQAYLTRIIDSHVIAGEGRYPVSSLTTRLGVEHHWHGGVHLQGNGEPIRAIADGVVAAFRAAAQAETYEGQGDYDTSFVLLRHDTQSGENTTVLFYSLYMHLGSRAALTPDRLQRLPQWLRQATAGPNVQTPQNQRVYRKEVLGFAGVFYGHETCHFEIFTTNTALTGFWRDSTTVTTGAGSADFFGNAHFAIPASQTFAARHPRAATAGDHRINFAGDNDFPLPVGQDGSNTTGPLLVTVELHLGRRVATTWQAAADGTFHQLGQPVQQDNYEYELFRLATALYPDCPSAGYEWLRFGRVLGGDTTTRNENWQLIRYSDTGVGYIDLAPDAIVKLSDADFPHWQGWERRDEGNTASATDGLCDDAPTLALVASAEDAAIKKLRHLICKHPSEWDSNGLESRFARHRAAGQALADQTAWDRFEQHVQRMAFWADAGIGDSSVWHFHPLQFIAHYRKCGWLSTTEMAQCFPREIKHLNGTTFETSTFAWPTALDRSTTWSVHFNTANRKFGLDGKQRLVHYFSHVIPETGFLRLMKEGDSSDGSYLRGKAYYPYYGRGLIQLTWPANYEKYGSFRRFPRTEVRPATYHEAGWNPDVLLARTNSNYHAGNCADSAGYYIVAYAGMVRKMDNGIEIDDAVAVSRCVNGNVAVQNLNGLDARLQSLLFIRDVLLDFPAEAGSETLNFTWRRNSRTEATGRTNSAGNPIKAFVPRAWNLVVSLVKQRP